VHYEEPLYRPPSEARSLIFQVTIGCARNTCTFCSMYKDKRFRIRPMDEIERDIWEAAARYGNQVRRIFLADGDALILPTDQLLRILDVLQNAFPVAERITAYGAPADVLGKSDLALTALREAGLSMIYMGMESGSDAVLKRVHKGVSAEEIVAAGKRLKAVGMALSLTMIAGLGGKALWREHAVASAWVVSKIRPDYLGALTLMLEPGAPLLKDVQSGAFAMLSPEEDLEEIALFLQNVTSPGTVFRSNHASNYLNLRGTLDADIPKMLDAIQTVQNNQNFKPEWLRGL
jgi:radical SAM superfamily enzyme YgiQ (UPF0313 family)